VKFEIVIDRDGLRAQSYEWKSANSPIIIRGLVFGEGSQSQSAADTEQPPDKVKVRHSRNGPSAAVPS
jgi:hypothetical protein